MLYRFGSKFLHQFLKRQSKAQEIERLLIQSRESLEFALESGRMGTWDIILKTNQVTCSKEMLDLWGISKDEFSGHRSILQEKVHPDDLQSMRSQINFAIKNDTIYEFEYRIFPRPGEMIWVLSRGRCTYDSDSQEAVRFSGVVYEITEKKQKEEALKNAMKIRDQFFMMASHELRTPLTSLKLMLQVQRWDLENRYPQAFSAERLINLTQKYEYHLSRITRIVDHILDESKISEGRLTLHREIFDLVEMVMTVLDGFKMIAESQDVTINFIPSESIIGHWDRFRIEQVLINLLMNAIRYGEKRPIEVMIKKIDEQVHIMVQDQGIGVKAEDQARIFERFERATPEDEGRGMGLGLYISNHIVRAHGGEILLNSTAGQGSTFTIVLPIMENQNQFPELVNLVEV